MRNLARVSHPTIIGMDLACEDDIGATATFLRLPGGGLQIISIETHRRSRTIDLGTAEYAVEPKGAADGR